MSWSARALLYIRTIRHLRLRQIVYRPLRSLQRRFPLWKIRTPQVSVSERIIGLRESVIAWGAGSEEARVARGDAVLRSEFTFLNEREVIESIDWQRRYVSHLWNYNLHYFDYALDLAWAYRITGKERYINRFVELALDWIDACPQGRGDGWDSYVISLRVVNWVYALLLCGDAVTGGSRERIESSIALQTEYLSKRLEYDILANHLQKNLKALLIVGLYFDGRRAQQWLRSGMRRLWRELFEQVLPDGMHYERSPMYHAIALGDFLEVISLLQSVSMSVPEDVMDRVVMMVRAFGVVSRPNGRLHLFNDSADGIAPDREWLDQLATRIVGEGVPVVNGMVALPNAGYYGYVNEESGERFLIDCGEPGPEYQMAHAHCDLLSFELDLGGRPVIVDSGVHGYAGDPFREYVRSTRAHNTVSIGGKEQLEIWENFRVARQAELIGARYTQTKSGVRFEGGYRPYHDLRVVHRRKVERIGRRSWSIADMVSDSKGRPLYSYIHLHPDFEVTIINEQICASSCDITVEIQTFGFDQVRVLQGASRDVQGWLFPFFGYAIEAPVIELSLSQNSGTLVGYQLSVSGNSYAEEY